MELLADYVLAEDHADGLQLRRKADTTAIQAEYPPLGEGAREFLERSEPLTPGELKSVKICQVCESQFIDKTKNGISKVCGPSCKKIDEQRRKRGEYNAKVHNIEDSRYKREWQRRQLEYGFYNPTELFEIGHHGEFAADEQLMDIKKIEREFGKARRKKPKFKTLSEIDADKKFEHRRYRYDPRGNDHKKSFEWGEVTTYKPGETPPEPFTESANILSQYSAILGAEKLAYNWKDEPVENE